MKKSLCKIPTLFFVFALMISCDRPECKNGNPVFDKYSPESKEYKDELVKQLKAVDNSTVSYWFDKYKENDSLQYLYVSIQGHGLCAKGVVTVVEWDDKLEGIHKAKGIGYNGAELKNLKFRIFQDSARTELIYQSIDAIID